MRPTRVTTSTSGRLGAQRADAALLLASMLERIELEMLHCVLVGDLGDRLARERAEERRELLGGIRPVGVAVREVGLPAEIVDVEMVDQLDADRVRDEAAEHVLQEHVRRTRAVRELVAGPAGMPALDVLGAPEEVGDPADVAFGQART